ESRNSPMPMTSPRAFTPVACHHWSQPLAAARSTIVPFAHMTAWNGAEKSPAIAVPTITPSSLMAEAWVQPLPGRTGRPTNSPVLRQRQAIGTDMYPPMRSRALPTTSPSWLMPLGLAPQKGYGYGWPAGSTKADDNSVILPSDQMADFMSYAGEFGLG